MIRAKQAAGLTLIELLISMTILAVVTTLVIMGWVSLQNSYSSTVKGAHARNDAREALSRMTREIRDMQPKVVGEDAIKLAEASRLQFYTSFNDGTAWNDPGATGLNRVYLVQYEYAYNAADEPDKWRIYRKRDVNGDGVLTLADGEPMLVASNIVNGVTLPGQSGPIPLFQYFGVGSATPLASPVDVTEVATIRIRVVADLNPAHAPNYFDLVTTVRPRNLAH